MRKTKKLLLVALALVIVALAALAACEPKPETFSLTFDFGYDNLKEVVEIKEGEKAQPRTASRDGYVFKGWYKDAAFSEPWDFENASVSGNVTLYAKWAKLFTVRFVHNYPDAPADKVIQAEEGQKVQNYVPQREEGYLFDGWSLNSATLTDEFVPDETPIYSDLTVYAFWTRSYNVSFFDGFGNLIEVVPVAEGQAASQPRNVLYPDENLDTVFIFDSWDRDVSCVTEDMSVNATWFYSPTAGTDFYTYTLNESMTGYILSINTENAWMCSVLALPESYNGLPVVEIAQGGIPSGVGTDVLYIPGTIKVIDNGMIAGASATHVYLGEGVEKILMHAFVQASAKDFHLPASVKLIEPFAFRWTRNLSDFIIAQDSPFSFDKERQMLFSENGERADFRKPQRQDGDSHRRRHKVRRYRRIRLGVVGRKGDNKSQGIDCGAKLFFQYAESERNSFRGRRLDKGSARHRKSVCRRGHGGYVGAGGFSRRCDRKNRVAARTDASWESVLYILPASYRNHRARHAGLLGIRRFQQQ